MSGFRVKDAYENKLERLSPTSFQRIWSNVCVCVGEVLNLGCFFCEEFIAWHGIRAHAHVRKAKLGLGFAGERDN